MHARNHSAGQPVLPELRLQIVDRDFSFRDCNYSLYPSWLAYPWANAHMIIRGTRVYAIDRCERVEQPKSDHAAAAASAQLDVSTRYSEGLDARAVCAALFEFAGSAPRPAKAVFNLNTTAKTRHVSGNLNVLGCRIASVGKSGELSVLGGLRFAPALGSEPGGPARTDGLRVRHRILIRPATRVQFVLPHALAQTAQGRPRVGQRIERVEVLPSVFTDSATFRALWPAAPEPRPGQRHRLCFNRKDQEVTVSPWPIPAAQADPAGEPSGAASAVHDECDGEEQDQQRQPIT